MHEDDVKLQSQAPVELDMFADYAAEENKRQEEEQRRKRERRLMEATLAIRKRYGKNALLKGMNFDEGATARERNKQIGGHKA
jgi:DNA polymerase V